MFSSFNSSNTSGNYTSVVKVFWDLNHCPIPHSCVSFTLTKSIIDIALGFATKLCSANVNASINAYGTAKSLEMLPSPDYTPISIEKIISNEIDKQCTDEKMFISDIAVFPIECNYSIFTKCPLITVIVISNDASVMYTLNSLKKCGMKICFITNVITPTNGIESGEYIKWSDIVDSLQNFTSPFTVNSRFDSNLQIPTSINSEAHNSGLLIPSYFSSGEYYNQSNVDADTKPQSQLKLQPPRKLFLPQVNHQYTLHEKNIKKRVITEEHSKAALQYYFQTNLNNLPRYLTKQSGEGHSLTFKTSVKVRYYDSSEYFFGYGTGSTKKQSEKKAALNACKIIIKKYPGYEFPDAHYVTS